MYELILITLAVLVAFSGTCRALVEYLEGCDLG